MRRYLATTRVQHSQSWKVRVNTTHLEPKVPELEDLLKLTPLKQWRQVGEDQFVESFLFENEVGNLFRLSVWKRPRKGLPVWEAIRTNRVDEFRVEIAQRVQ